MLEGACGGPGATARAQPRLSFSPTSLPQGAVVRRLPAALVLAVLAACGAPYRTPDPPLPERPELPPARTSPGGVALQDLVTGTTQRLQAVSAVNDQVVWVSGTGGTYGVTLDGGRSWRMGVVAGGDSLQFRDVHGVDQRTAYLLSSGPGTGSRIYKTLDGGQNWQLQFINREPLAFYDCFDFWDAEHGVAWSDNVGGTFPVVRTENGGQRWSPAPVTGATEGEGAFAASGTCLVTHGKDAAFAVTGAGKEARVFRSGDRGRTWKPIASPMVQGTNTTGHTTIAFRDERHGLAAGGDIGSRDDTRPNVMVTTDGGATWTMTGSRPTFAGAVYGAAYVPGAAGLVVAVGPGGASFSRDDGATWQPLDTLEYWSVTFASRTAGWMVGPGGRVVKVSF